MHLFQIGYRVLAAGVFCAAISAPSVGPAFAQDRPAAPAVPAQPQPVRPPAGPRILPAAEYLAAQFYPNAKLADYLERLHREFRMVDADADGEISEADDAIHAKFMQANFRALLVSGIMRADLNGDGRVTADELRAKLRYDARLFMPGMATQDRTEIEVGKLMAADTDHDGSISAEEAEAYAVTQAERLPDMLNLRGKVKQFLALAPEGKTSVAWPEVATAAEAVFRAADSDGDGTVSFDELKAYRAQLVAPDKQALDAAAQARAQREEARQQTGQAPANADAQRAQERLRQAAEMRAQREAEMAKRRAEAKRAADEQKAKKEAELRAACAIPQASDTARVVLIGSYGPEALSNVTIGSQDVAVTTGTIDVERGKEPLYVVVVSFEPTIWQFHGAVERIERLVVTTGRPERGLPQDKPVVGATNIPADKITFLPPGKCLSHFTEVPSGESAITAAKVTREVGKGMATIAGQYSFSTAAVPSGRLHSLRGANAGKMMVIRQSTGVLKVIGSSRDIVIEAGAVSPMTNLRRFSPGGVVTIDPVKVVAPLPVEKYGVLPEEAGLVQLLREGKIAQNRSGEYLIKKKIRFPADLYGAHSVKFLLLRGVPQPDGDSGHSTVISQETGEKLKFGG